MVTGTGIYIAYPRSETFKVAHEGPGTLVNCRHTKVGFATDSFDASASKYRQQLDNRVKFIPIAEVAGRDLPQLEKTVLSALDRRYARVGASKNWFDTEDRASIIDMIYSLLCPTHHESGNDDDDALKKAG